MKDIKLCLIGAGGVGKSCLVLRYVADEFLELHDATIEDTYRKEALIDDEACLLEILDTAGQEEFVEMMDQWVMVSEGFLLVYAINQADTFKEVEHFWKTISRIKKSTQVPVPVVLVGTKLDLENERAVSTEQGEELAKKYGWAFVETSAKTPTNIEKCFIEIGRKVKNQPCREEDPNIKKSLCELL